MKFFSYLVAFMLFLIPMRSQAMDFSGIMSESLNTMTEESKAALGDRYEAYKDNREYRQEYFEAEEEKMREQEFNKMLYKDNFLPKSKDKKARIPENRMGGLESAVRKPTRAFGNIRGRN